MNLIIEIELRKPLQAETLKEHWVNFLDGYTVPTGYTGSVPGRLWEYHPDGYLTPTGNLNAASPVWHYNGEYMEIK